MLEVRTEGPGDAPAIVVLCHGFGADEGDLVPLAGSLSTSTSLRFAFPRAPHPFPTGWGPGRAWFPDTEPELASFVTGEFFAHLDQLDPPSLGGAGELLAASARGLRGPAPDRRLLVGGFSQGAMVACEAMLAAGLRADGLICLSGSVIAAARWQALARARPLAGVPVFQAHGDVDPVLPFEAGLRLGETLDLAGGERTFVRFPGGHGIPPEVLDRLSSWLDAVCATGQ
ncbi:MAG: alpha/beta hydrolase [Spirochaetota bacterium]